MDINYSDKQLLNCKAKNIVVKGKGKINPQTVIAVLKCDHPQYRTVMIHKNGLKTFCEDSTTHLIRQLTNNYVTHVEAVFSFKHNINPASTSAMPVVGPNFVYAPISACTRTSGNWIGLHLTDLYESIKPNLVCVRNKDISLYLNYNSHSILSGLNLTCELYEILKAYNPKIFREIIPSNSPKKLSDEDYSIITKLLKMHSIAHFQIKRYGLCKKEIYKEILSHLNLKEYYTFNR